jgi:hypothetical protein
VSATLRDLAVRNGLIGVLAHGWNAELGLIGVDVETHEVGVLVSRGARARILDSTVRDGVVGIEAEDDSRVNLQNVVVSHHEIGVVAWSESDAVLNDTTVEHNTGVGVAAQMASRVLFWRGALRENGQGHVLVTDRSDLTLLDGAVVGSESDATAWAILADEHSSVKSYGSPVIHGDVSVIDGVSLRLGEVRLVGFVYATLFSDAHVRDAEVTDGIFCDDGADVICSDVTTPIVDGCPSSTCGGGPEAGAVRSLPATPRIEIPHLDWRARIRASSIQP